MLWERRRFEEEKGEFPGENTGGEDVTWSDGGDGKWVPKSKSIPDDKVD